MLLLLAGTSQARQIAENLAETSIPVVASLAGATRDPLPMPIETRVGGFGGEQRFVDFLNREKITAIFDATHPFAHVISERTAKVADEHGIPHCQLMRPQWHPEPGDNWTIVDTETQAGDHIKTGSIVFLATGRQTLDRYANLSGCRLICRQIDPPDREFPFENGEFLIGRPPFSVAQEIALFRKLNIDWLVVKNAGGAASFSKLAAARQLGIPVVMVARPEPSGDNIVQTVDQAVAWIRALAW